MCSAPFDSSRASMRPSLSLDGFWDFSFDGVGVRLSGEGHRIRSSGVWQVQFAELRDAHGTGRYRRRIDIPFLLPSNGTLGAPLSEKTRCGRRQEEVGFLPSAPLALAPTSSSGGGAIGASLTAAQSRIIYRCQPAAFAVWRMGKAFLTEFERGSFQKIRMSSQRSREETHEQANILRRACRSHARLDRPR